MALDQKALISLAFAAAATLSGAAWAEPLQISGSTTVQKRVLEPGANALKAATGVEVKVLGVGTGRGLIALFEGKVPAAAASESMEDAVDSAKKAAKDLEKTITVPGNLTFHEIVTDKLVVIVNKENPVKSLTKEQLKDIHVGKVTNWNAVGGPDLPIKVVTSHSGSATRAVFQKQVMDGAEYAASKVEVRTTREEINEVSNDKGAIGAVSEGFYAASSGKSKSVGAPTIQRPLGLLTVGKPTADVQKVIDFYRSADGKKLIQ